MEEEKRGQLRRASHCVWEIHYHMVLPVKYRKMLLERRVQEVLKETTGGIAERYEIEMEALGMMRRLGLISLMILNNLPKRTMSFAAHGGMSG